MNSDGKTTELLHESAPVFIGYMNAAARYRPDGGLDYSPFFNKTPHIQGSLPRLLKGGVDVAVISFGVNHPDLFPAEEGVARVFQQLGAFLRGVRRHADKITVASSMTDVRRARREGKLAVILHLTGVRLAGNLELLSAYHAVGVRCIHPPFDAATNERVDLWGGDTGLTSFGKHVVLEMQRLGMVVDLAHASDRLFRDVLRVAVGPVIVSHGTCRAISPTKRNMTDDQIRAVAATGGVIGIHFAGQLIDEEHLRSMQESGFYEALRAWESELRAKHPDRFDYLAHRFDFAAWARTKAYALQQDVPPPRFDKLIEHVDRIVELAGIDHVGIGADYDLGNVPPKLDRADKLPNLTRALRERGYPARDVRKLLGRNFLRVFESMGVAATSR